MYNFRIISFIKTVIMGSIWYPIFICWYDFYRNNVRDDYKYDFVILVLIGLLGSIANLMLTQSYKLTEVTLTTPLKYLSLVFAIIFGFYFFREVPSINTLLGAGLIVISSAIIFFRENQLKKPIPLPRQQ